MYLLEYNELGELDKITPDAPFGGIGIYVKKLPMTIEEQLQQGSIELIEEDTKIYYKIIKEI